MEVTGHIDLKARLEHTEKENAELKQELLMLKTQLQKFAQMIFGSKSERFIPHPSQLTLDIQTETVPPSCSVSAAKKIEYVKTGEPVSKKKELNELGSYLDHLPKVYETVEPADLPADAIRIGEERYELLESRPGELFVRVIITPKYKLPVRDDSDKTTILAAPAPERPLNRCVAGTSVLAQILVDKYCDHLPLFRQAKRFERNGMELPYNTMVDWAGKSIDLLSVLFEALKKEVIGSEYIHVDETGLKVLCSKENKHNRKIHDGYLWCYNNSIRKLVFFDYQPGRGEKYAAGILKDFRGFIQTDGWGAYEGVVEKQKQITQICCLAHARRKFHEALTYDKELAEYALTKFKAIYDIERKCKEQGLSYDEITKVRQQEAVPVLEELHTWLLQEYKKKHLPSSPISIAINYSLERWDRLCYYTKDGKLNPDNNPVERSIRPIAVGRKNYLFAGSHKGAQRLAMIYSLIGTCKMNGINTYEWLKDVFSKINIHPISKIAQLLPHNWKPEQSASQPAA